MLKSAGSRFSSDRKERLESIENSRKARSNSSSKFINYPTWKPEKRGEYAIKLFPYLLTNAYHPDFRDATIDLGEDIYYRRSYEVHSYNKNQYLCALKSFGQPCPFCDEARKYEFGTDNSKRFGITQKRAAYVVQVQGVEGFHAYDDTYSKFADLLEKTLNDPENKQYVGFYDPEQGYWLKVLFVEKEKEIDGNLRKWFEAADIKFVPRKEIPEETIRNDVPKLDDLFNIPDYDKLKGIIMGSVDSILNQDEKKEAASSKKIETDNSWETANPKVTPKVTASAPTKKVDQLPIIELPKDEEVVVEDSGFDDFDNSGEPSEDDDFFNS